MKQSITRTLSVTTVEWVDANCEKGATEIIGRANLGRVCADLLNDGNIPTRVTTEYKKFTMPAEEFVKHAELINTEEGEEK